MHECPGWTRFRSQVRLAAGADSARGKSLCRDSGQGRVYIGWARKNRNGNESEYALPFPPTANLGEIVGTHEPDKSLRREAVFQGPQRVERIARAKIPFHVTWANAGVPGNCTCDAQALLERSHIDVRL